MIAPARVRRCLSLIVLLAALLFVGWAIRDAGAAVSSAWRDPALWRAVAAAGAGYGLALIFVAVGWLLLMRAAAPDSGLSPRLGLRIYGVTQLYKYLPSNLFHYVGRHGALRRLGIGHAPAAVGAGGEIALLLAAAAAIAAAGGQSGLLGSGSKGLIAGGAVALALAATIVWAAPRLLARFRVSADLAGALASAAMRQAALGVFGCYLMFFALSGCAFTAIAIAAGPWSIDDALLLTAVWAGCWAIGFVTPGAPGGLGVREAALIAALTAGGGVETAAAIALAMRLATILGDLALAGLALSLCPSAQQARNPATKHLTRFQDGAQLE